MANSEVIVVIPVPHPEIPILRGLIVETGTDRGMKEILIVMGELPSRSEREGGDRKRNHVIRHPEGPRVTRPSDVEFQLRLLTRSLVFSGHLL